VCAPSAELLRLSLHVATAEDFCSAIGSQKLFSRLFRRRVVDRQKRAAAEMLRAKLDLAVFAAAHSGCGSSSVTRTATLL